jgi:hypothetical protein
LARVDGIISEPVGEELVVYDGDNQSAHALSAAAAAVWVLCSGERSLDQIAGELHIDLEIVQQALRELGDCGLLADDLTVKHGYSRREAAARFAKVAAATLSVPLIYSVAISPATAAASGCAASGPLASAMGCTADPGFSGSISSSVCCTGACYQGKTNGVYYCYVQGGCSNYSASCTSGEVCCATGSCNGATCTQ